MIYISGPMTGKKNKNFKSFEQAAKKLRKKGYYVVNPWEIDKALPQRTWETCLRRDIVELMKCNSVATLRGWKKSRGANLEVYIAKALKWPVHTVNYYI